MDDIPDDRLAKLFAVYYHLYLDKESMSLVQSQLFKLLEEAKSPLAWQEGRYGAILRFCNEATFTKVVLVWQ